MAKKKKKKVVKYKPARTKTKLVPSKIPGVDFDVIGKSKPAKKVVKTTVKKPRARKADSLPTMVITPTGSKYGDEPFVRTRKIPKDVTKRAPRAVPKRKSAVERERRVQFAKEHPLMQRSAKPPSLPTRLRGRPALDTSMLLAPLGAGPAIRAGIKGAKAASQNLGKRAATGLSGRSAARRKKPRNLRKRNTDYR